jgi:UrcA family protein
MNTIKHRAPSHPAYLLGALAACVLGAASAVAGTASAAAVPTVHVSYRDLNLATAADNRTLYTRITRAAHQVCPVSDIRDLGAVARGNACEREAVTRAVHAVPSTQLAALYAQTQPRS